MNDDDIRRTFGVGGDRPSRRKRRPAPAPAPAPPASWIPKPPALVMRFSKWFDWVAGQLVMAFLLGWQFGCVELKWNPPPRAKSAPAPAYKAPPPLVKRIEGGWHMEWAGSTWTCYFSPQGFVGCNRGGEVWHGDWSLDGRVLTIRQTRIDEAEPAKEWTVTLDEGVVPGGGLDGTIAGGGAFALRPDPATRR